MISNWLPTSRTIYKDCNGCGKNLADTTENFYVRYGLDTMYAVCKKCIAKSGNKKRQNDRTTNTG